EFGRNSASSPILRRSEEAASIKQENPNLCLAAAGAERSFLRATATAQKVCAPRCLKGGLRRFDTTRLKESVIHVVTMWHSLLFLSHSRHAIDLPCGVSTLCSLQGTL